MAVLGQASRSRRRCARAAASLSLAAVALAGCVLFGSGEKRYAFSHERHVTLEKLDCANCHADALASEEPGMPTRDTCDVCHQGIDSAKPPERRIERLFHGEDFAAAHATALSGEVVFSHQKHASVLACSLCHQGIESNERVADLRHLNMAACTSCHEEKHAPEACATCHKEIRETWAPPNHRSNWHRMHGETVRANSDLTADACSICHTQATCSACHQSEKPENHNHFWLERGHGITAMMDRETCAACHEPMSCQRCHQDVRPRNHVGNWGAPHDNHCLVCHQPLGQEGCVACHASAKSHLTAAPKPPDHYAGMDCRACHGHGQPLPHVDNGDDCNSCHL
jgi:hypothetical protein